MTAHGARDPTGHGGADQDASRRRGARGAASRLMGGRQDDGPSDQPRVLRRIGGVAAPPFSSVASCARRPAMRSPGATDDGVEVDRHGGHVRCAQLSRSSAAIAAAFMGSALHPPPQHHGLIPTRGAAHISLPALRVASLCQRDVAERAANRSTLDGLANRAGEAEKPDGQSGRSAIHQGGPSDVQGAR